ncbi:MAG: hypothetical protein AAFX94_04840, partial [Myxococcota bacterium]
MSGVLKGAMLPVAIEGIDEALVALDLFFTFAVRGQVLERETLPRPIPPLESHALQRFGSGDRHRTAAFAEIIQGGG